MPPAPATEAPAPLNSSLLVVTRAASDELSPLWTLPSADIQTALFDTLPRLVDKWALASASVAANWYDQLRESQDIRGLFQAIVPPLDDLAPEALAGWGGQPLRKLLEEDHPVIGSDEEPNALEAARYRVESGVQKRLVNAANATVSLSAAEDPKARGYMRRTRPGACHFCVMVASRGAVFTKASVTFACHENCYCECVPAWGGKARPVDPYKPSDKPSTAADRARVRKWIADNMEGGTTTKDGTRRKSTPKVVEQPKESPRDVARRQLPGLERSLSNLRSQGLKDDSAQVQYHLKQIAKFKAVAEAA
jgi:hypothetical protein